MTASPKPLAGLPLFPLQTVLFPGGVLSLKVFEARYLDLVSRCLRQSTPFGVVCLNQGGETAQAGAERVRFEAVGVLAHLQDVDAEQPSILRVRCLGGRRFKTAPPKQLADGLWVADTTPGAFAADDVALVEALADQTALAIEHARLLRRGQDAAVLEERTRLARDLHDSVTQSVFSLGMLARAAQTQHARGAATLRTTLERIERLAQEER